MKNWIENLKKVGKLEVKGEKITRDWMVDYHSVLDILVGIRYRRVEGIVVREGMKVEILEYKEVQKRVLRTYFRVDLLNENCFWTDENLGYYASLEEAMYIADKFCDSHPNVECHRVNISRYHYYYDTRTGKYEQDELSQY